MAHGAFMWNELMTADVEKAKSFYGKTLGWAIEEMKMPEGSYWLAKVSGTPVAGMMNMTGMVPAGTPPHWFSYVEVDDVDRRAKDAEANGGKVHRAPFDIPDVGRIAIIEDATGAMVGLMTPKR
ncbi:MAG TPA: VOC family protein [Stellaceae bacterium]|nr:VOC family protein [Stellaceae bacterium]